MPLFDTHAHYNLEPLLSNWRDHVAQSLAHQLTHAVIVGTDLKTCQIALDLQSRYPEFFYASLGIHPENVMATAADSERATTSIGQPELEKLIADFSTLWQAQYQQVAAMGEIGLDFFRDDKTDVNFTQIKENQLRLFRTQLQLARPTTKPIILHVRDQECTVGNDDNAYELVLQEVKANVPSHQLIFHCFSGNQEYLRQVLALPNSFVSFAGNLTFKSAQPLRDLLPLVPPERLLLETDAPFLSPEPVRGRHCDPWFLTHTATVAKKLGANLAQIYQNSQRLFTQNAI